MVYRNNVGNMKILIKSDRLDNNRALAQRALNLQIVADSTPYIPFQQGALRSQVRYPDGLYGATIEWYAPYAHYQYVGELYLTEDGRAWAEKDETKYPTGIDLVQHEKGTSAEWYERAKETHGKQWVRMVKRIAGGG